MGDPTSSNISIQSTKKATEEEEEVALKGFGYCPPPPPYSAVSPRILGPIRNNSLSDGFPRRTYYQCSSRWNGGSPDYGTIVGTVGTIVFFIFFFWMMMRMIDAHDNFHSRQKTSWEEYKNYQKIFNGPSSNSGSWEEYPPRPKNIAIPFHEKDD